MNDNQSEYNNQPKHDSQSKQDDPSRYARRSERNYRIEDERLHNTSEQRPKMLCESTSWACRIVLTENGSLTARFTVATPSPIPDSGKLDHDPLRSH